jgi:transposase
MVQTGKTRVEAAEAIGVNRRFVGAWVKAVERLGEAALTGGRRGRRPGEQKALSLCQERRIRRLIATRCPDQLDLPFALWTREAVGLLIERETGVRLSSRSTIGGYLHGWHFTAQRPCKRATERRRQGVRYWLDRRYPAIAKRAKAENGEIHWGDETGLSNQANYGRSFAPRGKTPIILRPATRFTCSMISTVTNRGVLRFMIYEGALNAVIFRDFLRRLVKDAPRKVFLIVDRLRVHRAELVIAWLRANKDRIELFCLPPYMPERNPDEFMQNDAKQAIARRRIPTSKATMKSGVYSYMRNLQMRPDKVRAFFQAPTVNYAI